MSLHFYCVFSAPIYAVIMEPAGTNSVPQYTRNSHNPGVPCKIVSFR